MTLFAKTLMDNFKSTTALPARLLSGWSLALIALAVGISSIAFQACSSGSSGATLVVVNGDEIPMEELDLQLKLNRAIVFTSFGMELDIRKAIVDTLIIRELLIQEAYKKGFDELEGVARVALSNKEKFLLDILVDREVGSDFPVSDDEIQDTYDKLEFKYRASHILVETREQAEGMLDSIRAGIPFAKLAVNHSIDPTVQRNQGDMGYFVWGRMVAAFQEAVIQLEPGEVSSPVKTKFGWHVIKLAEKIKNPNRGTLAEMKTQIKEQFIDRKRNEKHQRYFEEIALKYPVIVEAPTVEFLINKRSEIYPPMVIEKLPKGDFDLDQLDRDEKGLIMASWDGGQVTVGEYLSMIQRIPVHVRPDFDMPDSLAKLIFQLKYYEILGLEARREGIESTSEFKSRMKRFRELAMAEIMRDSVPQPPPPDEDQLLDYYDSNLKLFTAPAKMWLYEILVSDREQAVAILKEAKGLNKFKELAAELTERGNKRMEQGDLGWVERRWFRDIFDVAENLAIGEFGGPVATLSKWSVFYIVDKRSEDLKNYDLVKVQIDNILTRRQKDEAFRLWAEKALKAADITIFDDVLLNSIDRSKYPDTTFSNM